ncbi:MAG: hypothetical protein ACFFHV_20275 [Promethearchaeota archaeon]
MIIAFCLFVLVVLTFFSVFMGSGIIGNTQTTIIDGSQVVNGTTTTFEISGIESMFSLDSVQGAIFWITVIMTLVAVIGLRILASGLGSESVKIISKGVGYMGLWGTLSVLAFPLIIAIEMIGSVIYIIFTFAFIIGVFQKGFSGNE